MDAFISLSPLEQRLYCEQAQSTLNLPPTSIEKDFWVCWTLRELFTLQGWGEHLAFKGGTSLSKAWKLIERFSEDIDVVMEREFLGFHGPKLNDKQQKKLIKKCSERIQNDLRPALEARFKAFLPPTAQWSLTPASTDEDPDQQTLLFAYPVAVGRSTYLRPVVKIEMGARSEVEPSEIPILAPYLCDVFPEQLGDGTFSIKTVVARRTFWDKAMLLHEETYRPANKVRKRSIARHYYDLWCLIHKGVAAQAVADHDLFNRVAIHRQTFFGYSWMDYSTLRPGSLRMLPLPEQLAAWQADYREMTKEMFFGTVPSFEEILETIGQFQRQINRMGTPQ
ncbi:MAG TPA: nucleotidyl transferase AbiEii/AbiGii toxin family protein [Candidatus Limnocylindria bacterium]|nr:nucleotidyl transferase AbiEii/AbiGii toxin family protein [Candidatus Limnocylindria bacterium]